MTTISPVQQVGQTSNIEEIRKVASTVSLVGQEVHQKPRKQRPQKQRMQLEKYATHNTLLRKQNRNGIENNINQSNKPRLQQVNVITDYDLESMINNLIHRDI